MAARRCCPQAGPGAPCAAAAPGGAFPARPQCAAPAPPAPRGAGRQTAAQRVGHWNRRGPWVVRPHPHVRRPHPGRQRPQYAPAGNAHDALSPQPGSPVSSPPGSQGWPVCSAAAPRDPWGMDGLGSHVLPTVPVCPLGSKFLRRSPVEGGVDPVHGQRAGVGVAGVKNRPPSPLPRLRLLLPLWWLCVEGAMNSLGAKNSAQREDSTPPPAPLPPHRPLGWPAPHLARVQPVL